MNKLLRLYEKSADESLKIKTKHGKNTCRVQIKEKEVYKMQEIYCKAGRVGLSKDEALKIYFDKKYIVTSYGIFQPQFHNNQPEQMVSFHKISDIKGIAKRGRYHTLTGDEINHVLGYKL